MTKTFILDTNCFLDAKLFRKHFENVSQKRQEKICRLVHEGSKRLSLGAGIALAHALSAFGCPNAEIKYDERGKPFLSGSPFHISISHSGHYAVASISTDEVGVDIEEIEPISDCVVKRVMTASEQAQIQDTRDFYRLWTAKECILKITGDGLSGSLQSIDLHLSPKEINIIQAPISQDFCFHEFDIAGFCCTLCCKQGDNPLVEEIKLS